MYLIFFFFFLIQFCCIYLSTFVTCPGMFFLCICIVYVRYVFLIVAVFFSHKQASLVYNCYMSWDGFPMFLHCIRSLHFLKDVSDLCIFLFSSAV